MSKAVYVEQFVTTIWLGFVTFFTGNQLESIASWSLNDPMKVSITSLMLNMHTAEPLMALTGVLNTPYTIGSLMPVRAVFKTSLVSSASADRRI